MLIFLICVAADGDDADCWTRGVRDDDGLPRGVVLIVLRVLVVWSVVLSRCAGSLLLSPPTSSSYTSLGQGAWNRGSVLYHSAAWWCVLLDTLRTLRRQHRLGGGHLVGRHVPVAHLLWLTLFRRHTDVYWLPHDMSHAHIQRLLGRQ